MIALNYFRIEFVLPKLLPYKLSKCYNLIIKLLIFCYLTTGNITVKLVVIKKNNIIKPLLQPHRNV